MTRTLRLRREVLTELTPEELGAVIGGEAPTRPFLDCVTAAAVTVIATTALATALSWCVTCVTCITCVPGAPGGPDAG